MSDMDNIRREVKEYVTLKDQIDMLGDRRDVIKKRLLSYAESLGTPNEKGSLILEVNELDTGTRSVVKQRRVSKVFNSSAADAILNAKDLRSTCIKIIEVIDEDAIMQAYYQGQLTDEDIDTMFPEKEVFALVLDKETA
jgi:hypothetical protein